MTVYYCKMKELCLKHTVVMPNRDDVMKMVLSLSPFPQN